jgi:ParB family chromosome partitioning protein
MKIEMVPVARLLADPNNPRSQISADDKADLALSVRTHGIKVPLIGFQVPEGIMLGDGHRRREVAKELGIAEVPVIVFPSKPDEGDLLAAQLTINGVRHGLNPVDEYEAFNRLARLKKWNASELAKGLAVSNAEVTRVLAIGKLSVEERELVRQGKIAKSAAYALARMSPEQRATSVRKAASGELTRDDLNAQARKKPPVEAKKSPRLQCLLPGGTVSLQASQGLSVGSVIDLLEELLKECRKARSQGWDTTTLARVLRDRTRGAAAVPAGEA